tara:strand:- start:1201 stop:2412 length:1212 start_codon:yes stop_codon:yes gene_type:complete
MKKLILLLLFSLLYTGINIYGQGCEIVFTFQAIIKDDNSNIITNNQVKLKFSYMYTADSNPIYVEEHTIITPPDGVLNLSLGQGTFISGDCSNIDWSQNVFMKEELNKGNGYQDMGTRQIASVPVAEYAKRVAGLNTISSTISLDSNISSLNTTGVVSATSFRGNADQTTLTYSGTVTNVLAVISDLQRQIAELKELVNAGICLPKLSHQIDDYTLTEGVQAQNGVVYGMIDFCPQNNSGTASVTITGTVPNGLSFNWDDTTMDYKLLGTPAVGTAGTYSLTVVALIGSTTLTDDFVLTITSSSTTPTCQIELKSGLLSQTIQIGESIQNIDFMSNDGCSTKSLGASGYPAGLVWSQLSSSGYYNGEAYRLAGTPTSAGVYTFTVSNSLWGGTQVVTGTIIVQ